MVDLTQYPAFKDVFIYDPATGESLGIMQAQIDPVENTEEYLASNPPKYITPVHFTETAPPAPVDYKVALFLNGAWTVEDDFRGQVIHNQTDKSTMVIVDVGPIPSGYALTPPPPTIAEQVETLEADVQTYIDSKAQVKGYDSAASCISYLSSGNKTWAADALAMRDWRDAVWTFCYDSAGKVSVGTVPVPTKEQLIAALPAAPW